MNNYFLKFVLFFLLAINLNGQASDVLFHSHNDYAKDSFLNQALDLNFYLIEIDVFYRNGQFKIAHDEEDITEEFTLARAYLDPLLEKFEKGDHQPPKSLVLLIDFKEAQWKDLKKLNNELKSFVNIIQPKYEKGNAKPVKIIVSGFEKYSSVIEDYEYLFFDGRMKDLSRNIPSDQMPWISIDFKKCLSYSGNGTPSPRDIKKLKNLVSQVHAQGKLLRFWSTKDNLDVLSFLKLHKVDILGLDNSNLIFKLQ